MEKTSINKLKKAEREIQFFKNCISLKPPDLMLPDLVWRTIIRNVIRGVNTVLLGASRTGKTSTAIAVAKALNRPYFLAAVGSYQDARSSIIGYVHFSDGKTFLNKSDLVQALQTKDMIIVFDELSRIGVDGTNLLISITDPLQRCISLDEGMSKAFGDRIIKVDDSVSFLATANIGNEYTATRQLDAALAARFLKVNIPELDYDDEIRLLKLHFPYANSDILGNLAELAIFTRRATSQPISKLSHAIPTGTTIQMASLVNDGFSLEETAAAIIYPEYSDEGGVESERTYIKQKVQQYIATPSSPSKLFSFNPAPLSQSRDDDD